MTVRLSRFALAGVLALLPLAAFAKDGENSAGTLKFDESSFEVAEDAGSVTIRVERSGGEDGAVSVQYSTSNGSAVAGQDYTAASGTLSWGSGDESTKMFAVAIANDSTQEGGETFTIALSGATGGAAIDAERGSTTVVILANDGGSGGTGGGGDDGDHDGDDDDDGNTAGTIKFDERDFVAVEESGKAVITVERSGGESGAVSIQYSTANGTATAGQDYTATSGTLSWAAGDESSKSFTVPLLNDSSAEGTETVVLVLSNPTGGASVSAARGTAVLRIVDDGTGGFDDGNHGNDDNGGGNGSSNGKFEFRTIGFQVVEDQTNAVVRVERSRGAVGAVSVRLSTSDLSARAGEDYTATSVTLNWAAGDKADKTVQIPILADTKTEGNETVRLTLSNPTGGATLDDEHFEATLTILDDDGQTTSCVADDDTGCLSGNRFKVEVHWRTQDGTSGVGHIDEITPDSAVVWFFNVNNKEMLVKVIDACELGNYWVFFAATTNVDFTVEVTDTATGVVKEYKNPANNPAAPVQDTFTFGCN